MYDKINIEWLLGIICKLIKKTSKQLIYSKINFKCYILELLKIMFQADKENISKKAEPYCQFMWHEISVFIGYYVHIKIITVQPLTEENIIANPLLSKDFTLDTCGYVKECSFAQA